MARRSDPAREAMLLDRRAKVLQMRVQSVPPSVIAQQLGISVPTVHSDVKKALERRTKDLEEATQEYRSLESEKLESMERSAWAVMHRRHFQVSANGKVARHPETMEPLIDDAPTLAAINTLLRIQERRAKLLGLDAVVKSAVEVTTIEQSRVESDIARLFSELVQGRPGAIEGDPPIRPLAIEGPVGPAAS